jgi:glycosyltransferase involved in cell wall biosynthesis
VKLTAAPPSSSRIKRDATTCRMRIAIIAPPWVAVPPPGYGGTEAVIDGLARGLHDAGHDVLLFATGDSTCPVPRAWTLPAAVSTVNTGAATELRHVISAYDAISAWDADIVHDHTLVGPVYARHGDIPVVTTNHGPFNSELGDLYRVISDHVAVVAISRAQAAASGNTRIAAVIHHGLDVDAVPEGRGDGGYAVFLGRMSPDKGVDIAARVAAQAGVPLKIAAKLAEPAEREFFRTAVEPLLGRDVEYIGEVGGRSKHELLGKAICLLNPLRWAEPFGMVMIEALASGTPVVATPFGSVSEIVEHGSTGLLAQTERDLTAALSQVSALDRAACRAAVHHRFSLSLMIGRHLRLYERVIAERRRLRATHDTVPGRRRRTTDIRRTDRTSPMPGSAGCIVPDRSSASPFETRS